MVKKYQQEQEVAAAPDPGIELSVALADVYARAAGIDPSPFKANAEGHGRTKKDSGFKVPLKIVKQLAGAS